MKKGTKQHKETATHWPQEPASSVTSLSEMSARCSDRKGSGDWGAGRRGVWSEVHPVSGREKVSSLSVKMFLIFVSQTPNQ